ncbi:uncharacterized protein METZ01_LOCUS404033 [marine metagenome]|uniref:Uncharacterized protein n=1 Tax=marine metagenome TaxID=408172 RepID=A0A382VXG2_9ZZZZ
MVRIRDFIVVMTYSNPTQSFRIYLSQAQSVFVMADASNGSFVC